MIITDKYIYIHFPKSGGTFVSSMLKQLYEQKTKPTFEKTSPLLKPFIKKPFYIDFGDPSNFKGVYYNMENHNGFFQIPEKYAKLQVFTTIRNPFDFYVSFYETKKWVNEITLNDQELRALFPSFPELEFEEFLVFLDGYYVKKLFPIISGQSHIEGMGLYSLLTIFLYSTNPFEVYSSLQSVKDFSKLEFKQLKISEKINFLDYANLTQNLFNYLLNFNPSSDIQFIFHAKRENVTVDRKKADWETYYTLKSKKLIAEIDVLGHQIYNQASNQLNKN
jgi:hypothetical protein